MILHWYYSRALVFHKIWCDIFLDYAYITYRIIQCRGRDHHRRRIYFCKFRDGITKGEDGSKWEQERDVVLSLGRLRFFGI